MNYKLHAVNDPTITGVWWLEDDAMEELRESMEEAGLLDTETQRPPFPHESDRAALLTWQSQPSPDPRKVAAWKFASDEGWLVTPEECALIAQSQIEDNDGWITSFQQYCDKCSKKGGFQVW